MTDAGSIRMPMFAAALLALASCAVPPTGGILLGESAMLGNGGVQTYADLSPDGSPSAIGISFDEWLLDNLPAEPNTTGRCFDVDGDGAVGAGECEGDYELRIDMPEEIRSRLDITFEWVGFNCNPHGHTPAGVYDLPHFDMHFYTVSRATIDGIRLGPCETLINCDDRERAVQPVPEQFVPEGYIAVDAVVGGGGGGMGNHLLDSTSPELQGPPNIFTHTFIHGANDGSIIFFEPMITRAFLLDRPDLCIPLKLPQVYQQSAYFPTSYCMRYLGGEKRYTVSLEDFALRN